MERVVVVRQFIYPAIQSPPATLNFDDQFAFRRTSWTSAVLIYILQTVTDPLVDKFIGLDFTKAFTIQYNNTIQYNINLYCATVAEKPLVRSSVVLIMCSE